MGSSPDYEQAHRLNPDKYPKDPTARARELETQRDFLADELARLQKRSRGEVLADALKATSGMDTNKLPQRAEPKKEAVKEEVVGADDAAFFANPEQASYYPLTELPEDHTGLLFFKTAEDAEAKGYTLRPEPKGDAPKTEKTSKPKSKKGK